MEPRGLTALLDKYLRIGRHEKVALLYDDDRIDVLRLLEAGLKKRGNGFKSVALEHSNGSYTRTAVKLLEDRDYPAVILTSVKSIWHHPARKRAKYDLGKRLTSVIIEADDFDAGYTAADPDRMAALGNHLAKIFRKGAKIKITTPAGTDVEAIVEIPFLETGIFYSPGTGGNWPSGEIGFGPREGSVNGVIVYDVKFKHLGSFERDHARVTVEEDRCVKFDGPGGETLEDMFYGRDMAMLWVGEVAMGLNSGFGRNANGSIVIDPDPRIIVEEKALGTAHFGHGGNLSFGKRTGDHADGVVAFPTIIADGTTLLKDGRFYADAYPDEICRWLEDIDMLA